MTRQLTWRSQSHKSKHHRRQQTELYIRCPPEVLRNIFTAVAPYSLVPEDISKKSGHFHVKYHQYGRRQLKALCLTSRRLRSIAEELLYRTIHITSFSDAVFLLHTLMFSLQLRNLVRCLIWDDATKVLGHSSLNAHVLTTTRLVGTHNVDPDKLPYEALHRLLLYMPRLATLGLRYYPWKSSYANGAMTILFSKAGTVNKYGSTAAILCPRLSTILVDAPARSSEGKSLEDMVIWPLLEHPTCHTLKVTGFAPFDSTPVIFHPRKLFRNLTTVRILNAVVRVDDIRAFLFTAPWLRSFTANATRSTPVGMPQGRHAHGPASYGQHLEEFHWEMEDRCSIEAFQTVFGHPRVSILEGLQALRVATLPLRALLGHRENGELNRERGIQAAAVLPSNLKTLYLVDEMDLKNLLSRSKMDAEHGNVAGHNHAGYSSCNSECGHTWATDTYQNLIDFAGECSLEELYLQAAKLPSCGSEYDLFIYDALSHLREAFAVHGVRLNVCCKTRDIHPDMSVQDITLQLWRRDSDLIAARVKSWTDS